MASSPAPGRRFQESPVSVARANRLGLVGVPEEDDLGALLVGLVENPAELAGIDHPGLVEDEDSDCSNCKQSRRKASIAGRCEQYDREHVQNPCECEKAKSKSDSLS
ncbi:MAG: hypothetical protein M3O15_01625 [Acidobacteriota bacterium]|nr:hypothetical protein [Acidobacteriota bacterium]